MHIYTFMQVTHKFHLGVLSEDVLVINFCHNHCRVCFMTVIDTLYVLKRGFAAKTHGPAAENSLLTIVEGAWSKREQDKTLTLGPSYNYNCGRK